MAYKLQATVRQVMPAPIEGKVADVKYDAKTEQFTYLVQWTHPDGSPAERWFDEDQISEVTQ